MKFGVNIRKKLTGAELALRLYQILSLLPALYIVAASGYMALFKTGGVVAFLCELGFVAVPRFEALALSYIYRVTSAEVAVAFGLLLTAIAAGFIGGRLLRAQQKTAVTARVAFAALWAADLVLRVLPLAFNRAFSVPALACGFVFGAAYIVLTVLDLYAYKKEQAAAAAQGESE